MYAVSVASYNSTKLDPVSETKRVGTNLGDIGSLPNIRKQQARKGEEQPRNLNSSFAERSQICEESFNSRESQQKASKCSPTLFPISHEVSPCEIRTEGFQDGVIEFHQIVDSTAEVEQQPDDNNRRKRARDFIRTERLNRE